MTKPIMMLVGLYILGPLIFMLTNPAELPLPLLIVPFLYFFIVIFTSVWLLLGKVPWLQTKRRRILVAGVSATLPVLLLVFESIHQLTIRDVLLSLALVAVSVVYLSRADFLK